jgi:putative intracellular protease/amidase
MSILDTLFPFKSPTTDQNFDLKGKKAVVIGSNHATLDRLADDGSILKKGGATGVHASELTEAYYAFKDAGMQVTLASIQGGNIPLDPFSLRPVVRTKDDLRFKVDFQAQQMLQNSIRIADIQLQDIDIIYIAGGWSAAYDLMQSQVLADWISEAYANKKILAAVCHGPLGLCSAQKPDGSPLLKGVKATGVTNSQLRQLRVMFTPKHPEDELNRVGAVYSKKEHRLTDMFALHVVVDKAHRIVTGQNQKAGLAVAHAAMELLKTD